jgi:hypothetical protein
MRWLIVLLLLTTRVEADPLNAVIGDRGWIASSATSDHERIAAHLAYVEAALREASTAYPDAIRTRRLAILDRLAAYRRAGAFPHNTYVAGRIPVFVDEDGRRCAVGALAEHDLGAAAVEHIASRFRLAELPAIDDPALARWAAGSGFTTRELAMIQPSYGFEQKPRTPTREENETSAFVLAIGLAKRLCEIEQYPDPVIPAHTASADLATGKLSFDVQLPEKWTACMQKHVKRGVAGIGKRTAKMRFPASQAWVTKDKQLDLGKALGYMQFKLEQSLADCKARKRDDYDEYRFEIDIQPTGTVSVSSMSGEMDTSCSEKEIRSWKFPAGPAKVEHMNISVHPVSVAQRFAELDYWIKLNLKIKR